MADVDNLLARIGFPSLRSGYFAAAGLPVLGGDISDISQLSDVAAQSYPNETPDPIETKSLAAIPACVAAPSYQSCP
jgi:hypothetical protein